MSKVSDDEIKIDSVFWFNTIMPVCRVFRVDEKQYPILIKPWLGKITNIEEHFNVENDIYKAISVEPIIENSLSVNPCKKLINVFTFDIDIYDNEKEALEDFLWSKVLIIEKLESLKKEIELEYKDGLKRRLSI